MECIVTSLHLQYPTLLDPNIIHRNMTQFSVFILFTVFVYHVFARNSGLTLVPFKYTNNIRSNHLAGNVLKYLAKKKLTRNVNEASTSFMLELYNVLQSGSPLVKAAGRGNLNQADLTLSDTIRSFSPKG